MATNTDKTKKKKPQKRNSNSASMEELQRTQDLRQDLHASGKVQVTSEARSVSASRPAERTVVIKAVPGGVKPGGTLAKKASVANSGHVSGRVPAGAMTSGSSPSGRISLEHGTSGRVSSDSMPIESSPRAPQAKEGVAAPPAKKAKPAKKAVSAKNSEGMETRQKLKTGQTVHRRKTNHRPGMSALVPDVENPPVEEEFSSKPTVSFYDSTDPASATDDTFDPYAAADAAFEAGFADDESFESKKTQAFTDSNADASANGAASVSADQVTKAIPPTPQKPSHPSLRYRLASVALGKKAAVTSPDPNAQPKNVKPSGRSIVMPIGGKKEAVSDFVEAVSEKRPVLSRGKIVSIVVWTVVGILVLLALIFVWNRWWRYDDVLDVQGTWSANNSSTDIILNGEYMQLTDDVLYSYELDPFAKTITYEFGNSKGEGRYRFSFDRNELIITDGDYTWLSTLQEDIPWTLDTLWKNLMKTPIVSPLGDENVSVLKRISRDSEITNTPKSAEELAAWRQETREAEAKAEEEAMSGGSITVYSVTEGVPIEKPSEKDEDGENTNSDTANTGDGSDGAWQDDTNTWDDGSTWEDTTNQWDDGSTWSDTSYDQNYDQNYDYGYDQSYDNSYDPNYDYGYDQGYDANYDQNYDYSADTGYDPNYNADVIDQGTDATGADDGGVPTDTEGY